MEKTATVRNTQRATVDEGAALAMLPQMASAGSSAEVVAVLRDTVAALGLPAFVLIHCTVSRGSVLQLEHNLGGDVDLDAIMAHELVAQLASRPIPALFDEGQLSHPDLSLGMAVSAPLGETSLVLLLGTAGEHVSPAVLMGRAGLACIVAAHLGDAMRRLAPAANPLSEREREVMALLVSGCSAKEGAAELGISPRTFEKHAQRCRLRLGVATSLAAALLALRQGWLEGLVVTSRRQCGAG